MHVFFHGNVFVDFRQMSAKIIIRQEDHRNRHHHQHRHRLYHHRHRRHRRHRRRHHHNHHHHHHYHHRCLHLICHHRHRNFCYYCCPTVRIMHFKVDSLLKSHTPSTDHYLDRLDHLYYTVDPISAAMIEDVG